MANRALSRTDVELAFEFIMLYSLAQNANQQGDQYKVIYTGDFDKDKDDIAKHLDDVESFDSLPRDTKNFIFRCLRVAKEHKTVREKDWSARRLPYVPIDQIAREEFASMKKAGHIIDP
jgi:hypothetical protein